MNKSENLSLVEYQKRCNKLSIFKNENKTNILMNSKEHKENKNDVEKLNLGKVEEILSLEENKINPNIDMNNINNIILEKELNNNSINDNRQKKSIENKENKTNIKYINKTNNINNIKKNENINNISQIHHVNIINFNQVFNMFPNNTKKNNFLKKENSNNNQIKEKIYLNESITNNINNTNNVNNINNINDINNKFGNNIILNLYHKEQMKVIINNIKIIMDLLSTYKGSFFLQNSLDDIGIQGISILFANLYPYISKIMCLEYGNYFMQKLIKYLNVQQRLIIYQILDDIFLNIATDKNGTHVIQALIDEIHTPLEQLYMDKLLNKDMLLLFNDENGYHIIMKIILEKNENQRNNINMFYISNFEKIIINQYGAYCGSKFIINNTNLNLRLLLINKIKNNINLIFNKNSCSVILLAIKIFGIYNFEFMIGEIENNLSFLSLHPISNSFVCKIISFMKLIDYSGINNIIWNIFKNDNLIKSLSSHKNGNKLLKKLIECSSQNHKKYIKSKLAFLQKQK